MTNPTREVPVELLERITFPYTAIETVYVERQIAIDELRALLAQPADHLPPLIQCLRENGQQIAERAFDAQEGKYPQVGQVPAPVIGQTYTSTRGFGRMTYLGETHDIDGWLPTFRNQEGVRKYYSHDQLQDAFEEFAAAPKAPEGREWIACSERLPSAEQGTVAVLTDDGAILTAWASYWSGARTDFAYWTFPHGDDDDSVVTHWMPLPAAPALSAAQAGGGDA